MHDHERDLKIHLETLELSKKEKRATFELLKSLALVQRYRIFSKRGYSSLWEYVTKYLGYSESGASERLNALKLMMSVSEVETKIQSGDLNLTTAATIQRFIQKEEKIAAVSLETKKLMVDTLSALPKREIEKKIILFSKSPETHLIPLPKEKTITEQYTHLSFALDIEGRNLLDQYRKLNGQKEIQEIFKQTLAFYLRAQEKKNQVLCPKKVKPPTPVEQNPNPTTTLCPKNSSTSRYLPKHLRQEALKRANHQCQYQDPLTKKSCKSETRLQFDHEIPMARGGSTSIQNIRILCSEHNRLEAIRILGHQTMKKWFD